MVIESMSDFLHVFLLSKSIPPDRLLGRYLGTWNSFSSSGKWVQIDLVTLLRGDEDLQQLDDILQIIPTTPLE